MQHCSTSVTGPDCSFWNSKTCRGGQGEGKMGQEERGTGNRETMGVGHGICWTLSCTRPAEVMGMRSTTQPSLWSNGWWRGKEWGKQEGILEHMEWVGGRDSKGRKWGRSGGATGIIWCNTASWPVCSGCHSTAGSSGLGCKSTPKI